MQRYDLVGDYDLSMAPISDGDYLLYEDVISEIDSVKKNCAKLLSDKDFEYNKLTNDLIERHSKKLETYRMHVLFDAAELCDRFAGREMSPAECASAIRQMANN